MPSTCDNGAESPNVCAQLGHQAANCTNGTINWRQIYGDEAFRLKEPIYPSDIYRMMKEKKVDFTALEKQAQEWAKVCAALSLSPSTALFTRHHGISKDVFVYKREHPSAVHGEALSRS